MGSIKKNLFHIVDVEVSWIYAILEKPDIQPDYSHYQTIQQIARFSDLHRSEIESVIFNYSSAFEHLPVKAAWSDEVCTQGDILRHLIAHEIHHIGQISVWARESGSAPVSASYIGRKI